MTVIAWDGVTLAADKRCSFGSYVGTVTKIVRVANCLIGIAGDAAKMGEFIEWFTTGALPSRYPKREGDGHSFFAIVIRSSPTGPRIERYESTAHPFVIEDEKHAVGSGREYAAMAMYLGKSAGEAVALACVFDENCGNGVDELRLNP